MIKYLITGSFCLCTCFLSAQKENKTIGSKIEKVTVFLQGAQVERSAKQLLMPGKYNLVFSDISPRIDKKSIQLKADGKLTVLSVTHQLNHLKEQEVRDDIKQLEVQKEQLLEKISLETRMKDVYTQEEQMIIKNQSIKGDNTLKAAELKEAADFQRSRLTEIYQKFQENSRTQKKLAEELVKINLQLNELHQKKELSTSEVIVSVDVKENTSAAFRLSYLVLQSSWYPTYDIRVQDISQPLALQMKANLQQHSGEDWKEVKLVLSTGDPKENGTKPSLQPWYLRYYQTHQFTAPVIAKDEEVAEAVIRQAELQEVVVTGYGSMDREQAEKEDKRAIRQRREQTAVNTTAVYQPTTTVFEIEAPYTVPDDGKLYTVDISQFDLNAIYEYYAAPKLDPNAYLTAKIPDWQELNLLPGEANLFFEGTFLGTSLLDVSNAGDTLDLSLGRDKGVIVKRTLLKEFSSRKFFGSNKSDTRQYETTVRNNKQQPIRIVVEDQFPVSTMKEIEVDKLSYGSGKLEDDTKKVSWALTVDPKKENKLQLGYVVKYPKDRVLQLE